MMHKTIAITHDMRNPDLDELCKQRRIFFKSMLDSVKKLFAMPYPNSNSLRFDSPNASDTRVLYPLRVLRWSASLDLQSRILFLARQRAKYLVRWYKQALSDGVLPEPPQGMSVYIVDDDTRSEMPVNYGAGKTESLYILDQLIWYFLKNNHYLPHHVRMSTDENGNIIYQRIVQRTQASDESSDWSKAMKILKSITIYLPVTGINIFLAFLFVGASRILKDQYNCSNQPDCFSPLVEGPVPTDGVFLESEVNGDKHNASLAASSDAFFNMMFSILSFIINLLVVFIHYKGDSNRLHDPTWIPLDSDGGRAPVLCTKTITRKEWQGEGPDPKRSHTPHRRLPLSNQQSKATRVIYGGASMIVDDLDEVLPINVGDRPSFSSQLLSSFPSHVSVLASSNCRKAVQFREATTTLLVKTAFNSAKFIDENDSLAFIASVMYSLESYVGSLSDRYWSVSLNDGARKQLFDITISYFKDSDDVHHVMVYCPRMIYTHVLTKARDFAYQDSDNGKIVICDKHIQQAHESLRQSSQISHSMYSMHYQRFAKFKQSCISRTRTISVRSDTYEGGFSSV